MTIRFSFLGMHVCIHPSLWLTLALLGGLIGVNSATQLLSVALFVVAGFFCVLIHEFGHALVGRALGGGEPEIYLAWLGGDCCNAGAVLTRWQGVLMTAAGPLASLALGALVYLLFAFSLGSFGSAFEMAFMLLFGLEMPEVYASLFPAMGLCFFAYLLQVSFWWSVFNLLPIFPLDGGQIMNGLMRSQRQMHLISMVAAILCALSFFFLGTLIIPIIMSLLAFLNYRGLQQADH